MKKIMLTGACIMLVLFLVAFAAPCAHAAEPDTNFDAGWMERMMDTELSVVFNTAPYTDGAYAQLLGSILQDRFAEDPYGFAEALSVENTDIQEIVLLLFPYDAEFFPHLLTIANLVDPAELETVEAQQIMAQLQNAIWAAFGAANPGTGDPFDYSLLSEELKEEIKEVFLSTFSSELHWGEEYTSKQRYYGMFNESIVIFVTPNAPTVIDGWKNSQTVGNYEFTYPYGFRMVVYNGGRFTSITAAYDNGLLTDEDIGLIHSFHESFDMFMPPETEDPIPIRGIVTCMVISTATMVLLVANKKKFA